MPAKQSAQTAGSGLRVVFPQWQGGGNRPVYHLGSRLLAWLAPESGFPVEMVPISLDSTGLEIESAIFARSVVLEQAKSARRILERRRPDRIAIFGGDCSVDFAPFAYLNDRYGGDLAFIWLDAHPDLVVPDGVHPNFHAMVLSALLGVGDAGFVAEVPAPISPDQVLFAGLRAETEFKSALEAQGGFAIPVIGVAEIVATSAPVLDWIERTGKPRVAVHFDLDVLDTSEVSSTAGPEPDGLPIEAVVRLLNDIASRFDLVGLGITEYMPREALRLADMLKRLPLVSE